MQFIKKQLPIFLSICLVVGGAFGWMILHAPKALAGYTYSRTITLTAAQIPANQTNFTVLVCANGASPCNTTVAGLNQTGGGAHVQNSNGYDIVFSSVSDCSSGLLSWEMEKYVASTGEMEAWVLISSLSSSGNTIYMCYGNGAIASFQGGSTGAAWDSNYLGVYHLSDGSTLSLSDSTSNARNLTNNNGVTATTGQIDGAGGFASGSSQYLTQGSNNTVALTFSAWVKSDLGNAYTGFIENSAGVNYVRTYIKSGGKLAFYIDGVGSFDGSGPGAVSANTLTLVTFTYDSTNGGKSYINATADGTIGANGNPGVSVMVFGQDVASGGRFLNGVMDEMRVSNISRSANWVTTEYNNESSPSTFETFGAENSAAVSITAHAYLNLLPGANMTILPKANLTITPNN